MAKYTLGEVAPIKQGIVKSSEQYWLLNLDMVESNTGRIIEYLYAPSEEIGSSTISFDTGNVLYSKLRPYLNKVVLPEIDGYATSEMLPLRPNPEILSRKYLTYFLRSPHFVSYINDKTSGAKMPRANTSDLKAVEIECPPLDEQEIIAAIFDNLVSIIETRKEELQKLDELVKARFVELFGSPEYEKKQLIKLIQEGAGLSYGIVVPGDNVEDGIPMVRPSDFKNGRLNLDNVYRVSSDIECKYKKTRLFGDEILVQVIGQPGQVMLSDERCKGMNVTRNLAVIRIDKEKADRIFISHYLTTEEAQRFMFGSTNQSTLKQLPLNKLKELPVPLVPLSEQVQFADFVKQVDKSKVAVQEALDETQLLFDSLMQKYFG